MTGSQAQGVCDMRIEQHDDDCSKRIYGGRTDVQGELSRLVEGRDTEACY